MDTWKRFENTTAGIDLHSIPPGGEDSSLSRALHGDRESGMEWDHEMGGEGQQAKRLKLEEEEEREEEEEEGKGGEEREEEEEEEGKGGEERDEEEKLAKGGGGRGEGKVTKESRPKDGSREEEEEEEKEEEKEDEEEEDGKVCQENASKTVRQSDEDKAVSIRHSLIPHN